MPVLTVGAQDSLQECLRAFDPGADDWLVKAFEFAELASRLLAPARRSDGFDGKRLGLWSVIACADSPRQLAWQAR